MKTWFNVLFMWNLVALLFCSCSTKNVPKPNILFIMMDDLGYGQIGMYNDTITTRDFNPFYVHLVDSLEGYSPDKALEFSRIATPALSTLAKEGILFTNAYTSSNICAPSRLGIATGTLQCKWGVYTNEDCEQHGLVPGTLLSEVIHNAGYATAHIGKWHIGKRNDKLLTDITEKYNANPDVEDGNAKTNRLEIQKAINDSGYLGSVIDEHNPRNNGFDYYYGYNYWASQFYNSTLVWENFKHAGIQKEYNTNTFTDKAIDFMGDQLGKGKPFYVQLHYHAVHDSLEPKAPDIYLKNFNSGSFRLNNFFAHIYGVDFNVNRIVQFLKSKGQYENTLIVFTSDNGAMAAGAYDGNKTGSPLPGNTPFSGHKGTYFQGGIRVPFFMHWPNGIRKPEVSNQLVSTMDILPTAIDAIGAKVPEGIDGKSLLPLFENPDKIVHDHLIWAGLHSYKWGYLIKKTTKTHTTEVKYAPPSWTIVKDGYLLRFIGKLEAGIYLDYLDGRGPVLELYDIKNDPAEQINLAGEMPGKVEEMAKIYFNESANFPPPDVWKRQKWEELVNSKSIIENLEYNSRPLLMKGLC